jgi:hypothetical protein
MTENLKIFKYDNYEGDKGVIIAHSMDEAKRIFHGLFLHHEITGYGPAWYEGGTAIEELGAATDGSMYTVHAWF